MQCRKCNDPLPLSAKACFTCGTPVTRSDAVVPSPSASGTRVGGRVQVTSASPLRDRPYASARQITLLAAGQSASVLAVQGEFVQVELLDGRRGFIAMSAVKSDSASAPAPAPPSSPLGSFRTRAPEPPTASRVSERLVPAAVTTTVTRSDMLAASPAADEGAIVYRRSLFRGGEAAVPVTVAVRDVAPATATTPVTAVTEVEPPRERPSSASPQGNELPFNIPLLDGEEVRYRGVFLYNPNDDQHLVITSRRMVFTGGTVGSLPRVVHLDEIESVRLRDSGTGSTNGEGNLFVTVSGLGGAIHIGGVHMPHLVRNEILGACTDLQRQRQKAREADTSDRDGRRGDVTG